MSDSHDNLTNIQKAIGFFLNEGVEKIIHCGDMVAPFIGRAMQALKGTEIETVAIYGNNDGERDAFHSMMGDFVNFPGIFYDCNWNDCNIAVYHGTLDKILNCIIDSKHYEVVLCGHTHQKRVETRDGVLIVNPGECCGYLTGTATIAVIDLGEKPLRNLPLTLLKSNKITIKK